MVVRRRLLMGLVGVLLSAPAAFAQRQAGKIPRIGVLWHAGSAEEESERNSDCSAQDHAASGSWLGIAAIGFS